MSTSQIKNGDHFCHTTDDHPAIYDRKTSSHRFHHHFSNSWKAWIIPKGSTPLRAKSLIPTKMKKRDVQNSPGLSFRLSKHLMQTWQHQFPPSSQLENYLRSMRTGTIHAAMWIMQSSMWLCNFTVIGSWSIVVYFYKNKILVNLLEVVCLHIHIYTYTHVIDLCHSDFKVTPLVWGKICWCKSSTNTQSDDKMFSSCHNFGL